MARRNLEVIVTVRDAASKPLGDVEKKLKDTGKAANAASVDFKQFNRTLFATTAFVATFVRAFAALNNALTQGAELDRLESQYERVLGSKGVLLKQIKNLTTTSVDEMQAMREGLKLANLGLVSNSEQTAEVMAKAATAAKLAGLDSSEGMKKIADFMASGSISNLEFLGILARTNPALQAQLAILNKAGGIMGTVISTQQKLAIGMGLLNAAVQGQMKGTRDLADVMLDFRQNIDLSRREIGRFLGAALGPLIDKFSNFLMTMRSTLSEFRKNEKTLLFLSKVAIIATGAIVGLTGALGSLSLMVKLLSFAGIGLPALATGLITITSLFVGLTSSTDSIVERLKLLGGFLQGITQLIESLDPESGFAKMDKSLHDMLKKAGLLTLAQNIARVGSVIKTVVEDSIKGFNYLANKLDQAFGNISKRFISMLDSFKEPWNNWWVKDSITPIEKMVRTATVILGGFFALLAGKKLFGMLSGILGKIPLIGSIFGGGKGGKGPSGTSTDPIYVVNVAGALGKAAEALGMKGIIDKLGGKISSVFTSFMFSLMGMIVKMGPALGIAAAGALGYGIGTLINKAIPDRQNKYGQDINKVEALFGRMSTFLPKSMGGLTEDEYKDIYTPVTGTKKTSIAVPTMPDSQMDVVDSLGEQLKSLEGDKRNKFQQSVEAAFASGSAGGGIVTADEWTTAMTAALDSSENLSVLANKAKATPATLPPASRR